MQPVPRGSVQGEKPTPDDRPTVALPRPAATVVVAREGAGGVEILLMRRPIASRFAAEAWVFPGGAVDAEDRMLDLARYTTTPPAGRWVDRLAVADPGEATGYLIAGIRETWEETGILLAEGLPADVARTARNELLGGAPFADLLARYGMRLATDDLVYIAHWITPETEPRRYDARFFLARVSAEAVCELNRGELEEWRWARPRDLVEEFASGALRLLPPTIHTLRLLADFATLDEMWHALRDAPVTTHRPVVKEYGEGILNVEI